MQCYYQSQRLKVAQQNGSTYHFADFDSLKMPVALSQLKKKTLNEGYQKTCQHLAQRQFDLHASKQIIHCETANHMVFIFFSIKI